MTDTAVYDQQPTDISNSLQISQSTPNSGQSSVSQMVYALVTDLQ